MTVHMVFYVWSALRRQKASDVVILSNMAYRVYGTLLGWCASFGQAHRSHLFLGNAAFLLKHQVCALVSIGIRGTVLGISIINGNYWSNFFDRP